MNDNHIISWKVAGISLGLLLTLAIYLASPLGASTQFLVTDAVVLHAIAPSIAESNAESNARLSKYGTSAD
jgi:hypothetical protein